MNQRAQQIVRCQVSAAAQMHRTKPKPCESSRVVWLRAHLQIASADECAPMEPLPVVSYSLITA